MAQQEAAAALIGGDTGFEEADHTAYQIPMLSILQKLSPQVDKDESEYVKGAKPGMIYHNIRKEAYDSVTVIPAHYRKVYLEWVIRENGGGFRGEHGLEKGREMIATCTRDEKGRFILPDSEHQLSETANFYVLFEYSPGLFEPVLVSMASSQLKPARVWMSQLKAATIVIGNETYSNLKMNAYRWILATEKLENEKGKWFGWRVEQGENTLALEGVAGEASNMRSAVASNLITYNPEPMTPSDSVTDEENAL
jgi:hypothetical protein